MKRKQAAREFTSKYNKYLHYIVFGIGLTSLAGVDITSFHGGISERWASALEFGIIGSMFFSISLLGLFFKEVTAGGLVVKRTDSAILFYLNVGMFFFGGGFFIVEFLIRSLHEFSL